MLTSIALSGCKKKEDDTVAIDMTLDTYSANARYGNYDVTLQLNFQADGIVLLRVSPFADSVNLKYEVGDKMDSNTTLRIYGELDKALMADGLSKGLKIDWNTEIGRLSYKPKIGGFQAGKYHFTSY